MLKTLLLVSLGLAALPLQAATRVGVFGVIDEVSFEPSRYSPERIWISGIFIVPVPHSSGLHQAPSPGVLYFSLNPEMPEATLRDWEALKRMAGSGEVVGFGEYWVPRERSEGGVTNSSLQIQIHATRDAIRAQHYPKPNEDGVVTRFDTREDICPKFGQPSGEIIASLRRADGSTAAGDTDVPACPERQGLLAPSELPMAYAKQRRVSPWAEIAEAAVLDQIAQASGLQVTAMDVECRETICRLHLVFPTEEYERASGMGLASRALNEISAFSTSGLLRGHEASPTLEYYIQRALAAQRDSDE